MSGGVNRQQTSLTGAHSLRKQILENYKKSLMFRSARGSLVGGFLGL